MADDPIPPPSARHEALMVWVKLLGLLGALAVFCWVIFRLSRSLH
jgi:hypothetical protein